MRHAFFSGKPICKPTAVVLQVKLRAQVLAEMNAFLQKRHDEDEALKNEMDGISDMLNKYGSI